MTRGKCEEVELLVDREARGWDESERLRVEQHLADCESCLETLSLARLVRETLLDAPVVLSEAARSRAIERALASDRADVRETARTRRTLLWVSGAAVMAAAALLIFFVAPTRELSSRESAAEAVRSHEQQGVAAAPVERVGEAPRVEDQEPVWVESQQREQRTFAHAAVELEPGTRLRFDETTATLALAGGQVVVDVDVSKDRPFRVTTSHFRVEVLGTRFVVRPTSVEVERGHVQIFALDGSVLARELGAGAAFSYEDKEPRRPEAKKGEGTPSIRAGVWLARAREALSKKNTKSARELVARAEASEPSRAERAEGATLRAEAALLDGEARTAMRLYEGVAARYPELVAGENAAFAAAQLAARTAPLRARPLLARYIARYPQGRFVDEAKQRLKKLTAR